MRVLFEDYDWFRYQRIWFYQRLRSVEINSTFSWEEEDGQKMIDFYDIFKKIMDEDKTGNEERKKCLCSLSCKLIHIDVKFEFSEISTFNSYESESLLAMPCLLINVSIITYDCQFSRFLTSISTSLVPIFSIITSRIQVHPYWISRFRYCRYSFLSRPGEFSILSATT